MFPVYLFFLLFRGFVFDEDTIRPYLHILNTVNFNVLHIL